MPADIFSPPLDNQRPGAFMRLAVILVLFSSSVFAMDAKIDTFCSNLNVVQKKMNSSASKIAKARKSTGRSVEINVMKEMADLIQAQRTHDLIISSAEFPKDFLKSKAGSECLKKYPALKAASL